MDSSISKDINPSEALLISYIEGLCSDTEKIFIKAWLQQDLENEEILIQLAKMHFAYKTKERISKRKVLSSYNQVKTKINKKKRIHQLKKYIFATACITAILSTISTLHFIVNNTDKTTIIQTNNDVITIETNIGMRSNFYLPDGSLVYLNSGGSISYPVTFDKHERRISLRGEAYFKIKSDAAQPFYVDLPGKDASIKVLGTEFNLEAYEEEAEIRTTLLSGKVNILLSDKYKIADKEYELFPFQKARFDTLSEVWKITNTNGTEEIAWMQGKLIFNNTPLPDVLRELSHFYDVDFRVENKMVNSYRFTGVFDNRQLIQVLDYLKISSSIDYTVTQFIPQEEVVKKRTIITLKKI